MISLRTFGLQINYSSSWVILLLKNSVNLNLLISKVE